MKLCELIKNSLDGQKIIGKDGKNYLIEVSGGASFSICVRDIGERFRYGVISEIRDLGTQLFQSGLTDFSYVSRNGLTGKITMMISKVVPVGTSYRSDVQNFWDQKSILEYVTNNRGNLDVKDALERTCFGHVLLASKFNDVQVFYKSLSETKEGVDALLSFSEDKTRGIFTSSHGTELYLIGTKN